MHPNSTKHTKNISLGSNGLDRVRSLRKIPMRLCDMNFCNNCTTLSPFCTEFHAVMKWSQMHPNTKKRTKRWGYDPMGWIGSICCKKFRCDFMSRTFALIAPLQSVLHRVYCLNKTFPNPPEHYETLQNMSLGSYGVDRVQSLWETTKRLRGTNLCINCISSADFALSLLP